MNDEKQETKQNNTPKTPIFILGFIVLVIFVIHMSKRNKLKNNENRNTSEIEFARVDYKAPDFKLPNMSGKKVSLYNSMGKVIFINFWATWCPTCDEEMASMEKLYQRFKGDKFEMITVTRDKDTDLVAPYLKKNHLTFPVLLDPKNTIGKLYQTTGVPETFIVNKKGVITHKVIGPRDWTEKEIMENFRLMINL